MILFLSDTLLIAALKSRLLATKDARERAAQQTREVTKLQSAISKGRERIAEADELITKYEKKIENRKASIEKKKKDLSVEEAAWDSVGFAIRCIEQHESNSGTFPLPDGKYEVTYWKIDLKDAEKRYALTVNISSKLSVIGSNPKNLLKFEDIENIETQAASHTDSLQYLIVKMRQLIACKLNQPKDK